MALTDSLNPDHLYTVARQLGPFLLPFAAAGVPPASTGIAESLQVWTTSLKAFLIPGMEAPLCYHVWHHQLRPAGGGRANAYARSIEHDDAQAELRGVYQADVAGEIDLAVSAIDGLGLADDVKVRLLEVPDVTLMALWLQSPALDQYIPLGRFASPGDGHFAPISKQELVGRLPKQPISGLSREPPPDRRPDFRQG